MTLHQLKTVYPYFDDIWEGRKTFEVRLDDRIDQEGSFKQGDILLLREWNDGFAGPDKYTGRKIKAVVSYLLHLSRLFPTAAYGRYPIVVMGLKHIQCKEQ